MINKIIEIFICTLLFTVILPAAETINENVTIFINNYNDSSKILIELDIDGISYGQELLWKANTTGTNYEKSVVIYTDDIAYIGSCSTHGAGHDKIFAVNITNGEIIWDYDTGQDMSVQSLMEMLYTSGAVPMETILRMNTCMRLTG